MKRYLCLFLCLFISFIANGQVVIDGIKGPSEYPASLGNPIAVQTVETQFGDEMGGDDGSELDAMYYNVDAVNLYIFLAGNLQDNFNKIVLFIDAIPGGQNIITLPIPDVDVMDIIENMAGMQMDAGFMPDYFVNVNRGDPGNPGMVFGQFGQMTGEEISGDGPVPTLPNGIMVAIDNSNVLGVTAGTDAANQSAAAAVMTGAEYKIPLAAIGAAPGDQIKIMAFIGNGDYNFNSNQYLPGLQPPQGNLGGDGAGGFTGNLAGVNMNDFIGNQFVMITLGEMISIPTLGEWGLIIIFISLMISGILIIKNHIFEKTQA